MTRCFRARLSRTTEAEYPLEGQERAGASFTIRAACCCREEEAMTTEPEKSPIRVSRLKRGEHEPARTLFAAMAEIFEQPYVPLSDAYVDRLLAREDFWALAASVDDRIVGGLTAHTLPMTRSLAREIFIYDIA